MPIPTEVKKEVVFPQYLMTYIIGNGPAIEQFLPIQEAGVLFDSGLVHVIIDGRVLEANGELRQITAEERTKISDIADEYSANK